MNETCYLRTITDLVPGDHVCWLYETEEEREALLVPFLRQGLEKGEKVVYMPDASPNEAVLDPLRRAGIEVESYFASGQLSVLGAYETHTRHGRFDPDEMIGFVREETERALAESYAGFRVTVEMTWTLRGVSDPRTLIEYEANLNNFFPGSKCLAVCQYEWRRFEPTLLLDVLAAHPLAMVGTDICYNPYHIPSEELLRPNRQAATLSRYVENLKELGCAPRRLPGAREFYENLIENAGDAIMSVTPEGVVTSWNLGAQSLYGFTKDEVLGRNVRDLIAPTDKAEEVTQITAGVLSGHMVSRLETVRLRKDGSPVAVEITSSPIRDSEGNVVGASEIHKDIRERKRLEREVIETKDFLNNVIATAADAIISADADGIVRLWNPAAERLYGFTAEEAVGKSIFSLHIPENKTEEADTLRRLIVRAAESFETQRRKKEGSLVWVSITSAPLLDQKGRYAGVISIHKDITGRKAAEDKLIDSQEQLRSLASELSLAEKHERQRIAEDLHHNVMQGLASYRMKLRKLRDKVSLSDVASELDESLVSLDKIIEDTGLLTFELSSPAPRLEGFEAAVEWFAEKCRENHDIACEFEDDGRPKPLDEHVRVHLFRAVQELLLNVTKHAQARIAKVAIRRDGKVVRVEVEDDGVGFDPSKIAYRPGGTGGFGLFNIRERLGYLGGYVKIESEPGKGTRVTLVAPLKADSTSWEERRHGNEDSAGR